MSNQISQNQPNFDPSHSSMLIKLETHNYCRKTNHHAKRYFDRTTWVVWAITQFSTVRKVSFFALFGFFVTHTGRTGGLILTIYTSYDAFPRKDVPFEVLLIHLPIYVVKSPKNVSYLISLFNIVVFSVSTIIGE